MKRNIIKYTELLNKSTFVKDVFVILGGTGFGQILILAVSPIITRLYTPEDLGIFSVFFSYIAFSSIIASFRYELAIVSATDSKEANTLLLCVLIFISVMTVIITFSLYILIKMNLFNFAVLPTYSVFFVFPFIFLTAGYSALRYYLVRVKRYGIISKVAVSQNAMRAVSTVGLGICLSSWLGLLLGDMIGRMVGISTMIRPIWRKIFNDIFLIDFRYFVGILSKYRKFPIFSMPTSLMETLFVNIPIPLILYFYGTNNVGYFALAQRVLCFPMGLVGLSVADIFHNRVANYYGTKPENILPFFLRSARYLFLLGLGPSIFLIFFGPGLFTWVFGQRWEMAGSLVPCIIPWVLVQFVVSPLSRVIYVVQAQEIDFIYSVIKLILEVGALCGSYYMGNHFKESITILSLVNAIGYAGNFLLLYYVIAKRCKI